MLLDPMSRTAKRMVSILPRGPIIEGMQNTRAPWIAATFILTVAAVVFSRLPQLRDLRLFLLLAALAFFLAGVVMAGRSLREAWARKRSERRR